MFRGLFQYQHAIEATEHGERQDDLAILSRLVRPTEQVRDTPDKAHLFAEVVHGSSPDFASKHKHLEPFVAQSSIERVWPTHVVCYWLGNSTAIAHRHYLMTTNEDFAKAAHDPAQQVTAEGGTERNTDSTPIEKSPILRERAASCDEEPIQEPSRNEVQDS